MVLHDARFAQLEHTRIYIIKFNKKKKKKRKKKK